MSSDNTVIEECLATVLIQDDIDLRRSITGYVDCRKSVPFIVISSHPCNSMESRIL